MTIFCRLFTANCENQRTIICGAAEKVPLKDEIMIVSEEKSAELLALDEALENLAKINKTKSKIVELRYFGGLSVEETVEVLGVLEITAKCHWRMAKA